MVLTRPAPGIDVHSWTADHIRSWISKSSLISKHSSWSEYHMSPLPISFFVTQRCDLSTTVKKTRIFIFFPSCVQIINSSCSRIIVNMNHESFKLLLMTLMMIKLYKITVFTKNTISFYRNNNKKIVIFCRKLRFCFTQKKSTVASSNRQIRSKKHSRRICVGELRRCNRHFCIFLWRVRLYENVET